MMIWHSYLLRTLLPKQQWRNGLRNVSGEGTVQKNDPRSGYPKTLTTDEQVDAIHRMILEFRRPGSIYIIISSGSVHTETAEIWDEQTVCKMCPYKCWRQSISWKYSFFLTPSSQCLMALFIYLIYLFIYFLTSDRISYRAGGERDRELRAVSTTWL